MPKSVIFNSFINQVAKDNCTVSERTDKWVLTCSKSLDPNEQMDIHFYIQTPTCECNGLKSFMLKANLTSAACDDDLDNNNVSDKVVVRGENCSGCPMGQEVDEDGDGTENECCADGLTPVDTDTDPEMDECTDCSENGTCNPLCPAGVDPDCGTCPA